VAHAKKTFLISLMIQLLSMAVISVAQADIVFPEDELPSESVIPRLDSPRAAMNRTVEFSKKFETKLSYGFLLDEPFYQNSYFALGLGYSWSEISGVTFRYLKWGQGLSDYSRQFGSTTRSLQFDRAKGPDTGYSLSYDYRFFYGKVSFSKKTVLPTVLGSVFEAGMIKYGVRSLPFYGTGLVNSWYFSKPGDTSHFGINVGVRIYLRTVVDPLSQDLGAASVTVPVEGDFTTATRISTTFDLGAQYIF
jgi:outer membrane beta-barrel protein